MRNDVDGEQPTGVEKRSWLKKRVVPVLTLSFIIAIVVGVIYLYQEDPEFEALQQYGYLGAFFISIILNATVILPVGNFAIIFALGAILPLFPLVGLAGGLGAAIGEMTGYMAGYSGRGIIQRQTLYKRLEEWVKKWGALTIFGLSVVPFFFDLAGIAAGALRFPVWKFFVACWLGRTVLYIGIAGAGAMGMEAVLDFIGG